jgi:hypothetical protein
MRVGAFARCNRIEARDYRSRFDRRRTSGIAALGRDDDLDRNEDVAVKPQRHFVLARRLDRVLHPDAMSIDRVTRGLEGMNDVEQRHRSEQPPLFANLALERERHAEQTLARGLGGRPLARLALRQNVALGFDLPDVSGGRLDGEAARQQEVAAVAATHANDLSAISQMFQILPEEDFHVRHVDGLLSVSPWCRAEAPRCGLA